MGTNVNVDFNTIHELLFFTVVSYSMYNLAKHIV